MGTNSSGGEKPAASEEEEALSIMLMRKRGGNENVLTVQVQSGEQVLMGVRFGVGG